MLYQDSKGRDPAVSYGDVQLQRHLERLQRLVLVPGTACNHQRCVGLAYICDIILRYIILCCIILYYRPVCRLLGAAREEQMSVGPILSSCAGFCLALRWKPPSGQPGQQARLQGSSDTGALFWLELGSVVSTLRGALWSTKGREPPCEDSACQEDLWGLVHGSNWTEAPKRQC